jgi:hypothetical protein
VGARYLLDRGAVRLLKTRRRIRLIRVLSHSHGSKESGAEQAGNCAAHAKQGRVRFAAAIADGQIFMRRHRPCHHVSPQVSGVLIYPIKVGPVFQASRLRLSFDSG